MKVSVTQGDIDAGQRSESASFPVALAIKRLFPHQSVDVAGNIRIDKKFFAMPQKATDFTALFDASEPVAPFEFYLPDTPICED